jgi:UPF0176 protein
MDYSILAFYKFVSIEDPDREVKRLKEFFASCDLSCRIYLSHEGINGQMSAKKEDAERYMVWMRSDPRFADMSFKVDPSDHNVFPRVTVKHRRQLVALDHEVDLANRGEHLPPAKWKEMLESDESHVLVDVRNKYEWEVGHFEGAELPDASTFREFPEYARQLRERVDPRTTPVMMYCTGGIRCELYSALMKEEGFDKVYQLDGGVINYGHEEGGEHWKGKLFVFDDRMTTEVGEACGTISSCAHCGVSTDHYFNCADMDCNTLFLSCTACLKEQKGCCQKDCQSADRLRPYEEGLAHPFRRISQAEQKQEKFS